MSICPNCGFRIGKNNRIKVKGCWEHIKCPKEGVEHKKKITDELIKRSNEIFNRKTMILTGEGLTKGELKALERIGRVKRVYYKAKNSLTLRCVWMRPSTFEMLKIKAKEEAKEPTVTKLKLNLFQRIWNFIKKIFGGKNVPEKKENN